jgi:hypothetical protein
MPPTTRIDTIATEKGSGAYQTRRLEKQDEKTWWEHDIKVLISFCNDIGPQTVSRSKWTLDSCLRSGYRIEHINQVGNNAVEVAIEKRDKTPPAEVEKQLGASVKEFLESMRCSNVATAKFDFTSNEKREVKNYDVWDGVDRMVV